MAVSLKFPPRSLIRAECLNISTDSPRQVRPTGEAGSPNRPFYYEGRPMRVACYVDGFNLYHAIDDLQKSHLKCLPPPGVGAIPLPPRSPISQPMQPGCLAPTAGTDSASGAGHRMPHGWFQRADCPM